MRELWADLEAKARKEFRAKNMGDVYTSYSLYPVIAKANDDLRQEVLAMQLIRRVQGVFRERGLNELWLRPYEVFVTSCSAGFIEFIPDTISIDQLKKRFPKTGSPWTLKTYYEKRYGSLHFEQAQISFIQSLAAYSLFNFVFSVKDRHNGNILVDAEGHLIHIDFGFMM
jgi:phosphatidylinositol 4-kinase